MSSKRNRRLRQQTRQDLAGYGRSQAQAIALYKAQENARGNRRAQTVTETRAEALAAMDARAKRYPGLYSRQPNNNHPTIIRDMLNGGQIMVRKRRKATTAKRETAKAKPATTTIRRGGRAMVISNSLSPGRHYKNSALETAMSQIKEA